MSHTWFAALAVAGLLAVTAPAYAAEGADAPATKEDIRMLVEQMDKRFEQAERRFEQIDKRFEQVERRFEQIDKRFEFIQMLLIALFTASIGMPLWIERQRRSEADAHFPREFDRLLTAMREAAVHNPQFKEVLSAARLL